MGTRYEDQPPDHWAGPESLDPTPVWKQFALIGTGYVPLALASKDLNLRQEDVKNYLEERLQDETSVPAAKLTLRRIRAERDKKVAKLRQILSDADKLIDAAAMQAAGLFKNPSDGVRLLGNGEIKTKIEVKVAGASASAIAAVEKAGGKVELPPKPAAEAA